MSYREPVLPKRCPKGTSLGEAAKASQFGFARCILDAGHDGPCDSGPAPEPPSARAA